MGDERGGDAVGAVIELRPRVPAVPLDLRRRVGEAFGEGLEDVGEVPTCLPDPGAVGHGAHRTTSSALDDGWMATLIDRSDLSAAVRNASFTSSSENRWVTILRT